MIATSIIKTAASLTLSLYDKGDAVTWTKRVDDPICWAIVKVDDLWYLVFRGSVTRDDWEHDFEAIATWCDDLWAHVHPGFHDGVKDILLAALSLIGDDPYVIVGHSLGAARAAIASAYAILLASKKPLARIVWGEPRPGFMDFARILTEIPNYNFVNGNASEYDRVTDVPFTLPFEWYCAGSPHLFVCESPTDAQFNGIFAWHNFVLYNAAMQKFPDGEM